MSEKAVKVLVYLFHFLCFVWKKPFERNSNNSTIELWNVFYHGFFCKKIASLENLQGWRNLLQFVKTAISSGRSFRRWVVRFWEMRTPQLCQSCSTFQPQFQHFHENVWHIMYVFSFPFLSFFFFSSFFMDFPFRVF